MTYNDQKRITDLARTCDFSGNLGMSALIAEIDRQKAKVVLDCLKSIQEVKDNPEVESSEAKYGWDCCTTRILSKFRGAMKATKNDTK